MVVVVRGGVSRGRTRTGEGHLSAAASSYMLPFAAAAATAAAAAAASSAAAAANNSLRSYTPSALRTSSRFCRRQLI